ncbi:MAG: hypothetical protein DELT_02495 [Desulfovibrio sp.]
MIHTFSFIRSRVPAFFALVLVLALPTVLTGCVTGGTADPYSKRYTAADINPAPHILNSAIVKGTNLSGLRLENVLVKDATFLNTTAKGAYFKNVVFDNCRFINAKFDQTVLENVLIKGGILTCENDVTNHQRRTVFSNSSFTNLVIDGAYLEHAVFDGSNGSIALRNVQNVLAVTPVITGKNMRITMQNSVFQRIIIAEVTGASSLTAVGCTFYHATFGQSTFENTAFSKNVTYGGPIYVEKGRTSHRRTK